MPTKEKFIIRDWKRLWQMVSGVHYETPVDTVREELLGVSSELLAGLAQFRDKSSSNVQLVDLLKEKKQEKLLPFTKRLQDLLNLESAQCWEVLCYYLTKEYRGSANMLTQLIATETSMSKLLEDIRQYYSLERMIVLKIVRNLLVFYNVPNHPYHKEYRDVVQKLSLSELRDSYLSQLENLLNESPPPKLVDGESFDCADRIFAWAERNARETNEILHILTLICEYLPMKLEQLKRLIMAVKQHSFGHGRKYLNESIAYHEELATTLRHSELVLLLKCLDFEKPDESTELIAQIVRELDGDISSMHHRPEHGPLLLAWMLLRLRGTNDADDASSLLRCRQFGKRAVDLMCFIQLHKIVSHSMFADDSLLSRIARRTIYNQLCYMCDLFDGDGSCAQYNGIYELLSELLAWPELAKDLCSREDEGVRSLYNTLLENFPLGFTNLAKVAHALAKGGQGNYIKAKLERLPMLALLYDDRVHRVRELGPDEFVLTEDVRPFPGIEFIVPAGTTCTAVQHQNNCFMHFRVSVNFFEALHHEINCLLRETVHLHGDFDSSDRIHRIEAGLDYLEQVLKRTKSIEEVSTEMVHPTEMCVELLHKFKTVQYPPISLLSRCLNICTALLPLVDEEIFRRISNLDILPSISNETLDFKHYSSAVTLESRFLGYIIDNVEKKRERYDFLFAYLHFLRTYTKLKRNRYLQVEIPGLIFLLHDVFPHLHTWHFQSKLQKNKIYFEILSFLCDILDIISTSEVGVTSQQEILRNVCVYSLLNLDNGMVLLRFVGVGNTFVQHTMEMESNWMQQQPHGLMMLVRLSMRILMQVLRLKHNVYHNDTLSPLEALIYTQPKQRDTLRIIPIVCTYMSNIFDRWLPILSCRLLKRIALEFNMSMLACLDMEADQIRLMFLQKLPDELESDPIKIAILELVDACIAKQPGVTEAFFKVTHDKRSFFGKECTPSIGESIVVFLREFLDVLEAEPMIIQQSLPCRIMDIFNSLWKNNLQMLVDELKSQPRFWNKLCAPLFNELQSNVRVYTQLLNIISIEAYSSTGKNNVELKAIMEKFFEKQNFERWLNYALEMPKVPAIVTPIAQHPDWLSRLQAFKDLTIILLKKQPKLIIIPEAQVKLLAEKCLTALVDRAQYLEDMRPLIVLSELYVFVLSSFHRSHTRTEDEDRQLMEQLLQLMSRICSCYEDLHVRAKEAFLTIITKFTHLFTDFLIKDSSLALRFLNSVVSIICTELQYIENSVHLTTQKKQQQQHQEQQEQTLSQTKEVGSSSSSLILCLNLIKAVATTFSNDGPSNWDLPFVSVRLFQRLLACTAQTLQICSKQPLSIQLLDVLIVFAKSRCSAEFMHCDVEESLWLNLLPPKELLQEKYGFTNPTTADKWTLEKWWPVYARGIELVNIIYDKHKKCFLRETLQFVGIHESHLVYALLLGKQSLEPAAMHLIKSTISLIASLAEHRIEWQLDHPSSLISIMSSVHGLMAHSMTMFHQQRKLKCLIAGRHSRLEILRNTDAIIVDDEIITACNDLTEIIIYCVKALQPFSPDLLNLLCSNVYEPNKWEPILEVKLGAPKISEENISLSFGMATNMVAIYVKALSMQNYGFSEVPLNTLDNVEDAETSTGTNRCANADGTSGLRVFSKSLSTTSISSATCPSNELLVNLDSHLCLIALEHILMLVATQSIYMIRLPNLDSRWKQIVRRDISSELHSFHEFVRRKVIAEYRDTRCQWVRRKHGLLRLPMIDPAARTTTSKTTSPNVKANSEIIRRSSNNTNELRVNVVRRLHLQQQMKQQPHLEMSRLLSPIAPRQGQPSAISAPIGSTPNKPLDEIPRTESRKRLYADQSDDYGYNAPPMEVQYFQPSTEHGFCEQSLVQLVEEDYLQLMSSLLCVIPQSE